MLDKFLGSQRFVADANAVFKYDPVLFDGMSLDSPEFQKVLELFIGEHKTKQVPRLKELKRYYLHDNNIHYRESKSNSHQADNRIASAYAQYITIFMQGYILGNPVTYENDNKDLLTKIEDFNKLNHVEYHDSLIETDLSIYGRAYELVYLDEDANERLVKLPPESTFVVYDDSVDPKPLFGVRYYSMKLGDQTTYYAEAFSETETVKYKTKASTYTSLEQVSFDAQALQHVAINEFKNNDDRIGDYENILDNIDAYDLSQSELANFQQDSNDAILVITGNPYTGTEEPEYEEDEDGNLVLDENGEAIPTKNSPADVLKTMIRAHILVMDDNPNPDGAQPDAKWLVKQYDTQGSETYKSRIVDDILRFTFTPDTNDQNFAGTQSGEAMKYKLLGNDNLRKVKERLLTNGFLNRLEIVSGSWAIKDGDIQSIQNTKVVFTPNLPEDDQKQLDMATAIHGIVSNETTIGMISTVTGVDTKQEMKRLKKQQEEQAAAFSQYPDPNQDPSASGDDQPGGDDEDPDAKDDDTKKQPKVADEDGNTN